MVTFEGQHSKSDLRRAARLHLFSRRRAAMLLLLSLALVGVVIAEAVLAEPSVVQLFPLFLLGFFAALMGLLMKIGVDRTYRTNRLLQEPLSGEADAEGIRLTSTHGNARLPWNVFFRRKASDELLLLYQADNLYFMFPARFFPSAVAWHEFRRLAEAGVPARPGGRMSFTMRLFVAWYVLFILVVILWSFVQP